MNKATLSKMSILYTTVSLADLSCQTYEISVVMELKSHCKSSTEMKTTGNSFETSVKFLYSESLQWMTEIEFCATISTGVVQFMGVTFSSLPLYLNNVSTTLSQTCTLKNVNPNRGFLFVVVLVVGPGALWSWRHLSDTTHAPSNVTSGFRLHFS